MRHMVSWRCMSSLRTGFSSVGRKSWNGFLVGMRKVSFEGSVSRLISA